jgi:thymidylate synthase ThyX
MPPARDIYLLNPRELRPEVIAVAFAKTSRSPESFRAIAAELTDERSAEFHEKWVVGYGHASVAEHAVLHIALENISRLAIESVESARLASYTEKSTRYQIFERDGYYVPEAIAASRHAERYHATCRALMTAYFDALEPLRALTQAQNPRRPDESERRWDGRIRSRYVDNARFLLPAATLANVGMTANARLLEHLISKLLSHPLAEVREVGAEIKAVAQAEVPTLVKYAERSSYQAETAPALERLAGGVAPAGVVDTPAGVRLVDYPEDAEERVLAAVLYRFGHGDYEQARAAVRGWPVERRAESLGELLGRMGPHDAPLRELEHVTYTVDALMDQGAYFEAKRHRMMTQSPQALTPAYGYTVPQAFGETGLAERYRAAQEQAAEAYLAIAPDFPHEASYLVTNAYRRRVLMTLNLREAFHFCRLRSAPNAHFSIRHIALELYEAIRRVHPALAEHMGCADRPPAAELRAQYFGQG